MKNITASMIQHGKDAIAHAELRHCLHGRLGLYADHTTSLPYAQLRIDHECRTPLWRVLAVLGILMALYAMIHAFCRRMRRALPWMNRQSC